MVNIVAVLARYGKLGIGYLERGAVNIVNKAAIHQIRTMNTDKISVIKYRRPLRDCCLSSIALARCGVNPHLRVIALNVGYIIHHQTHAPAVGDKLYCLRILFGTLRQPPLQPYLR